MAFAFACITLHFPLQNKIAMKLMSLLPIVAPIALAGAVFSQNKSPGQLSQTASKSDSSALGG